MTPPLPTDLRELDRLRELARIGAGQAAGALARLLGRSVRSGLPVVHGLRAARVHEALRAAADSGSAVFFELHGGLLGTVAVVFPAATLRLLVRELLGGRASRRTATAFESAVCEVGNMLVSSQVSAIADALATAIVPSVPLLAEEAVPVALAAHLRARGGEAPLLAIESELVDAAGEVCSYLVLMPDGP